MQFKYAKKKTESYAQQYRRRGAMIGLGRGLAQTYKNRGAIKAHMGKDHGFSPRANRNIDLASNAIGLTAYNAANAAIGAGVGHVIGKHKDKKIAKSNKK